AFARRRPASSPTSSRVVVGAELTVAGRTVWRGGLGTSTSRIARAASAGLSVIVTAWRGALGGAFASAAGWRRCGRRRAFGRGRVAVGIVVSIVHRWGQRARAASRAVCARLERLCGYACVLRRVRRADDSRASGATAQSGVTTARCLTPNPLISEGRGNLVRVFGRKDEVPRSCRRTRTSIATRPNPRNPGCTFVLPDDPAPNARLVPAASGYRPSARSASLPVMSDTTPTRSLSDRIDAAVRVYCPNQNLVSLLYF